MAEQFIKSIRLSEQEQHDVLDAFERDSCDVDASRRSHERVEWHLLDVAVMIVHPEGGVGRFIVAARNLSAGGMAFIHGGFLYPGSKCEVSLPTVWGGKEVIAGKVVSCRHRQGQQHEIGVQFKQHVDPRRFIADAAAGLQEAVPGAEDKSCLGGRLLCLDPGEPDRRLLQFHLRGTNVSLSAVPTIEEALASARAGAPDLVLLELNLGAGATGEEALRRLREQGYKGPAIFLTGETDPARLKAAKDAGASDIMLKPYGPGRLYSAISPSMTRIEVSGEPNRSTLTDGAEAADLVKFYLGYVEGLTNEIRAAIDGEQADTCLRACRTLMDTGAGYGFAPVARAARAAVSALVESSSVAAALSEVQRLLFYCGRLSAEAPPAAEPAASAPEPAEQEAPAPSGASAGAPGRSPEP